MGRNQIDKGFDRGIKHFGTYYKPKTQKANQPFRQADLQINSKKNNQSSHSQMYHHVYFRAEHHSYTSESMTKALDAFFH